MDIWRIEERATKNLILKERIIKANTQIEEINIKGKKINKIQSKKIKKKTNFKTPITPNLSINLAKIIEQVPEALTCAFVNQKWKKNNGSLNKKIKLIKIKIKKLSK